MRRILRRPALLEFFRVHLILTAIGDVTALSIGILALLLGSGDGGVMNLPVYVSGAGVRFANFLVSAVLLLCLLAYPVVARVSRRRSGWPRPDAVDAALVLLLPALAFWILLSVPAAVFHNDAGIQVAAVLLNSPAYGLSMQFAAVLGPESGAWEWLGYVGTMISGLLPPLLFLIGSYPAIPSVDEETEDYIEKQ